MTENTRSTTGQVESAITPEIPAPLVNWALAVCIGRDQATIKAALQTGTWQQDKAEIDRVFQGKHPKTADGKYQRLEGIAAACYPESSPTAQRFAVACLNRVLEISKSDRRDQKVGLYPIAAKFKPFVDAIELGTSKEARTEGADRITALIEQSQQLSLLEQEAQKMGVKKGAVALPQELADTRSALAQLTQELQTAQTTLKTRPTKSDLKAARQEGRTQGLKEVQEETATVIEQVRQQLAAEQAAHQTTQAQNQALQTENTRLTQGRETADKKSESLRQARIADAARISELETGNQILQLIDLAAQKLGYQGDEKQRPIEQLLAAAKADRRQLEALAQSLGVPESDLKQPAKDLIAAIVNQAGERTKKTLRLKASLTSTETERDEFQRQVQKIETQLEARPTEADVRAARQTGQEAGRQEAKKAALQELATTQADLEIAQGKFKEALAQLAELSKRANITPKGLAQLQVDLVILQNKVQRLEAQLVAKPEPKLVQELEPDVIEQIVTQATSEELTDEDIAWLGQHQTAVKKVSVALEQCVIKTLEEHPDLQGAYLLRKAVGEYDRYLSLESLDQAEELLVVLERLTDYQTRIMKNSVVVAQMRRLSKASILQYSVRTLFPRILRQLETISLLPKPPSEPIPASTEPEAESQVPRSISEPAPAPAALEAESAARSKRQAADLARILTPNQAFSAEQLAVESPVLLEISQALRSIDWSRLSEGTATPSIRTAIREQGQHWLEAAIASGLANKNEVRIVLTELTGYLLSRFPYSSVNAPLRNFISTIFNPSRVAENQRLTYLTKVLSFIIGKQ